MHITIASYMGCKIIIPGRFFVHVCVFSFRCVQIIHLYIFGISILISPRISILIPNSIPSWVVLPCLLNSALLKLNSEQCSARWTVFCLFIVNLLYAGYIKTRECMGWSDLTELQEAQCSKKKHPSEKKEKMSRKYIVKKMVVRQGFADVCTWNHLE